MCFSRFLCLPQVRAVSVLHIFCLWWLKLSSQWKSTHWVQGVVTSCFCLVLDFPTYGDFAFRMEDYAAVLSHDGQGGALLREVAKLEKFEANMIKNLGEGLSGMSNH